MGGSNGRTRKPIGEMEAQGTINRSRVRRQGRDAQFERGPNVVRGIPTPPTGMAPEARAAYRYYADELHARGVLALSDGPALAELAQVHTDLIAARVRLRKRGSPSYETARGTWKTYPEVGQVATLQRQYMSLLRRFGLTPDARKTVNVIAESAPRTAAQAAEDAAWARLAEIDKRKD